MRKFLHALLFIVLLTGLSVTATYAGTDCAPGCDCTRAPDGSYSGSIYGEQQVDAQAEQVKQKGYAQEVIKMPDNGAGLTCLDRTLAMTSSLGKIFSDKFPNQIPPEARSIFGPSKYPDAGTGAADPQSPSSGGPFSKSLKNVISENLQNYVQNFNDNNDNPSNPTQGSLSAMLGATNLNYLDTVDDFIMDEINISGITGTLANVTSLVSQIDAAWNQYSGFANLAMTGLGLTGLAQTLGMIVGVMNSISGYATMASGYMGSITLQLGNILNSFINIDHLTANGGDKACSMMAQLWGNMPVDPAAIAAGFQAVTGAGSDKGSPYFSMKDLLNSNIPTNVGLNLVKAIQNDGPILNNALYAITQGILSGPGSSPTWPATPIIPANATANDIISLMD